MAANLKPLPDEGSSHIAAAPSSSGTVLKDTDHIDGFMITASEVAGDDDLCAVCAERDDDDIICCDGCDMSVHFVRS